MTSKLSLWVSDLPSETDHDRVVAVFEDVLGLSHPRALEHAGNLSAGSVAQFTSDNTDTLARVREAFGLLGCRFEEALVSRAGEIA